jgi:hypothetical protein
MLGVERTRRRGIAQKGSLIPISEDNQDNVDNRRCSRDASIQKIHVCLRNGRFTLQILRAGSESVYFRFS